MRDGDGEEEMMEMRIEDEEMEMSLDGLRKVLSLPAFPQPCSPCRPVSLPGSSGQALALTGPLPAGQGMHGRLGRPLFPVCPSVQSAKGQHRRTTFSCHRSSSHHHPPPEWSPSWWGRGRQAGKVSPCRSTHITHNIRNRQKKQQVGRKAGRRR